VYYIHLLNTIRARPIEHLGRRSLVRLEAFHNGYSAVAAMTTATRLDLDKSFRTSLCARYGVERPSLSIYQILMQIAHDDERGFDLFFVELDSALTKYSGDCVFTEACLPPGPLEPASAFIEPFGERPRMYFAPVTVGALRAFLDGFGLAAIEANHPECLDLAGFDDWVRQRFEVKGFFRWDDALLSSLMGDEAAAFECAIREIKAFRSARKGEDSPRKGGDSSTVSDSK